ncbi:hypothetical protein [Oribacterium sp. NK2B42]|uniref:hypothetical protein n=1 Tax=Oribacterium sp. NK2B42 TaxID=689781 RepID=UPI000412F8C8|nr:hypothetical protein [Oribacterium sp. NK2B42]
MRVTASTFYKDYAKSVQDLKSIYNKSMQQVSSGKKYENAYENPLDYYAGKKIDNLYNDVVTKDTMIKDVINRLEQQETTSRTFHSQMSDLNIKYEQMASASYQGSVETVDTMYTYVLNKQQTLTQDLNATYENYYVMGGNDQTTIPFTMSADGMELTYHHKFPGDSYETTMTMKYDPDNKSFNYSGTYYETTTDPTTGRVIATQKSFNTEDEVLDKVLQAMKEQGRMSLGYGDINTLETLPDTYYGGLNMVTGLTSDKLRAMDPKKAKIAIQDAMNTSAFGLNAQVIDSTKKYRDSFYETMTTDTTTTTSITSNTTYASLNTVWSETALALGNYVSPYIQFSNGSQMSIPFSDTIGNFINDYNSNHDPETDFLSYDENTGIMTHFYYGESSTSPPIITNSVPVITTTTQTVERPMTEEEKEISKESALQKLNEDLNYALGKWDNAMISVSNTFRRIGVATATLDEVDNQLQTAQDTYIKEYNDHMAIDTYDAIVQMYQHMYSYNAAMQVGSKIMQNSLFDFVQ